MPDALATRYFVDDLPAASVPGTRIRNALEQIDAGRTLNARALAYFEREGLRALHSLASGAVYDSFAGEAAAEQMSRARSAQSSAAVLAADVAARASARQEAEERMWREREEQQLRREASPAGIARKKTRELRERFAITDFIEDDIYPRLLDVVQRLASGQRLPEEDVVWLSTQARQHHTAEIRAAFHTNEATHYTQAYDRSGDPWQAISASGHWRRAEKSTDALAVLDRVPAKKLVTSKLQSAFFTTRGGVMRDLRRHSEAVEFGQKAHALLPDDFRPCTLLGAVHIELGEYGEGQRWYELAVARGAPETVMDSDVRSIFLRADACRRAELSVFLLKQDAKRFAWARPTSKKSGLATRAERTHT